MAAGDRLVAQDRVIEAGSGPNATVIVLDAVGEGDRAANIRLRLLLELNRRRPVGNRLNVEGAEDVAGLPEDQLRVAFEGQARLAGNLARRRARARWLRVRRVFRRLQSALYFDCDRARFRGT